MVAIDLIYDLDCPNVPLARANLLRAVSRAGVAARWQEHAIGDPEAPARTRGYGSPTILVDGIDVAGGGPGSEASCRLYGESGAPDVELIVNSLAGSLDKERAAPSGGGGPGAPAPRWSSCRAPGTRNQGQET